MSKLLRIHRLRAIPSGWFVRFGGADEDFREMRSALKSEYPQARWVPDALGKKRGAWLVTDSVLRAYQGRFENYRECVDREERRQELEQRRREALSTEQREREQGITRDIHDCPF